MLVNTHALKAKIIFMNVYGEKYLCLAVFTGNIIVIPMNVMYNKNVPINDVINGSSFGTLISATPVIFLPNLKSSFGGFLLIRHTIKLNTAANKNT